MGLGGLHIWHLLIILLICVVIFGTKRLKDIGSDLGGAVKGFRKAMSDAEEAPPRLERPDADFGDRAAGKRDSERHGNV
ncbi:MAG: twin-arginine translocase TatA/TatE family subunit [Gammaproteobacteria bacterium]|jgi:sec-independent protein translocase protein TatA|nr:twin-arginine translocase TatA/TatE family subunit [Gammaproteobacteria bacterium]